MGSVLLIGAGSSSSDSSGGGGALQEIFHILYKVGSDPASAVFGKHTLTYDAVETASFTDYLSAAAAAALLETVYNDVSVTLINKGYRVAVVDPTGNLADPTVTPSTDYILNDGTGTAPTKTSQRNYSAEVAAEKEQFTVTLPATPDTETVSIRNTSITDCQIVYDNVGNISSQTPPTGFNLSGGGVGGTTATYTQSSPSAIDDFSIYSGLGSLSTDTQGVTGVTTVTEVFTLTVGSSDGTVGFGGGGVDSVTGNITNVIAAPTGYTQTGGGVGLPTITFTANSAGVVSDMTVDSDTTGGASINIDAQGVDGVTEVAEAFTYTTGGAIARQVTVSNDGGVVSVHNIYWTSNLITGYSSLPTGFSVIDGGIGFDFVQFEKDAVGVVADYSFLPGDSYGASISTDQQGVDLVAEVLGQCVIGFTGVSGYFTFADGFAAVASSVAASGADIKALLNGASGYNAVKVDTVSVDSISVTVNYAATQQPTGTITVGGRTGATVAVSVLNIQDGT